MATSVPPAGDPVDHDLDALTRTYAAIIDEARKQVAAGREPNSQVLEERLRAAGRRVRSGGSAARVAAIDHAERVALQQLERVATVHRARLLLARRPPLEPEAPTASGLRAILRTRPTITGNMDVRRQENGETLMLTWDAAAAVTTWEVRFSERPDVRADYVVREELALPAAVTAVEVPLGEHPMRVHLLGRSRDGRLLRRALISSLTRDTWSERWQRRPSAS